jgi:hypothetical protein
MSQNYSEAIPIALEKDIKSTAKSPVIREHAISCIGDRTAFSFYLILSM